GLALAIPSRYRTASAGIRADLECTTTLTTALTALNVQIAALRTKVDELNHRVNQYLTSVFEEVGGVLCGAASFSSKITLDLILVGSKKGKSGSP
ncbi:hypothetical protein L195_g047851, partial [Trifolium pratense]